MFCRNKVKNEGSGNNLTVYSFDNIFLGTASKKYVKNASKEIKSIDSGVKIIDKFPDGVFLFSISQEKNKFFEEISRTPPIFLRHIQPIDIVLFFHTDHTDEMIVKTIDWLAAKEITGKKVAVQVRKMPFQREQSAFSYKKVIDKCVLEKYSAIPTVKNPDIIISLYICDSTGIDIDSGKAVELIPDSGGDSTYNRIAMIGMSTPRENLCERSGGIVRFAKEPGQLSRSGFKLLEAFEVFNFEHPEEKNALDLGASPGGWSKVLLEKGYAVTAIDRAPVDPELHKLGEIKIIQKDARLYSPKRNSFDILTNDMNRDPAHSANISVQAAMGLKQGAPLIMTIKLTGKNPEKIIQKTLKTLERAFVIKNVRQLYNNREEVTILGTKK
ncbi:MAG: hypothetical protein K8T10_09775 [Candidatus Eremiobacteraeota bacterium]|nr:hypothetical protein [Candidatus Eremiobacteraeota bacterium]